MSEVHVDEGSPEAALAHDQETNPHSRRSPRLLFRTGGFLHIPAKRFNSGSRRQSDLRGFRVSKDQKSRALTALETVGLISVERQLRKSPLVTLNWKPIKR